MIGEEGGYYRYFLYFIILSVNIYNSFNICHLDAPFFLPLSNAIIQSLLRYAIIKNKYAKYTLQTFLWNKINNFYLFYETKFIHNNYNFLN